jgi:hypothetical protein
VIGVVLAVAVLAVALFVALRTAEPRGVAVSPWPFIIGMEPRDLFIRNIPPLGSDLCDAHPTQEALRELHGYKPVYRAVTTCIVPAPGHARPYGAHVGLIIEDDPISPGGPLFSQWTWLEPERVTRPPRQRRWTWWRRLVVRLAAP